MSLRKILVLVPAFVLSVGAVYVGAQAHGKKHNPVRFEFVMKNGIPAAYQGKSSQLTLNNDDIAQGAKLYADNCASCHGPTGAGDGPDAKDLKPKPPELQSMMTMIMGMRGQHGMMKAHGKGKSAAREMSMMTEGYLYWTLSEGGEAMETAMPGFKDALSENERWQIILYMGNGFRPKRAQ